MNVTQSPGYPLVILMMAPFLLAEYSGRGLLAGPLTTSPEVLKTESWQVQMKVELEYCHAFRQEAWVQTSENARTRVPSILTAKNPNSLAINQPPADAKASPPLMEVSIVMVLPSTLKAEVPPVLPLLESSLPLSSLSSSLTSRSESSPESVTPHELMGMPKAAISANGVAVRRKSARELVLPLTITLKVVTVELS